MVYLPGPMSCHPHLKDVIQLVAEARNPEVTAGQAELVFGTLGHRVSMTTICGDMLTKPS